MSDVAEKIRQIFVEEYSSVPENWKKWKHSGLREAHMKQIEKEVLAAVAELEQAYEASCQAYEMVEKERDNAELRLSDLQKHFEAIPLTFEKFNEEHWEFYALGSKSQWIDWIKKGKKLLDGGEQQ